MAKKIKFQKKNRVCRTSGCKHILSIYNPEWHCHVHQQLSVTRPAVSAASYKS